MLFYSILLRLAPKMSALCIAADLHPSPLQLYGKRAAWEDPSKWVNDTYPWNAAALHREGQSLLQLRPEDVGYDGYSSSKEGASSKPVSQSDTEGDPLVRKTHTGKVPGVQRIGHPFVITASPKQQQQKQNKTVFMGLRWCFWILGVSHPDSCFFSHFCFQMNMLLRLQEAANYSSTQSCDSDSTSHHDEQLDSSLESAL